MSATTTLAPSAANRFAVASPIPEPPPVISATLPSNRISISRSLRQRDSPRRERLTSAGLDARVRRVARRRMDDLQTTIDNLTRRVQRLEDELAIHRLIVRY